MKDLPISHKDIKSHMELGNNWSLGCQDGLRQFELDSGLATTSPQSLKL